MNDPPRSSDQASPVPATPRLAPSTLGEILDRTIQLYRSRFLVYLGISLVPTAVVVVPACAIVLGVLWVGPVGAGSSTPEVVGVVGIILLAVIGLLAVPILTATYALTLAAMPYAASRDYLGEKTTIREAYKSVWRDGWRYCWLLILEGLIIGVAAWVGVLAIATGLATLTRLSGVGGGALVGLATFVAVVALIAYFFLDAAPPLSRLPRLRGRTDSRHARA